MLRLKILIIEHVTVNGLATDPTAVREVATLRHETWDDPVKY